MDENTLERLANLVKGMHDQGMSIKQIEDNLNQMGLSKDDTATILNRAGLKPSTADVHETVSAVHQALTSGEAVKPVIDKLSETEEHFQRLNSSVSMLHDKHKELSDKIDGLSALSGDISEIKREIIEIKAELEAIKKLQQDLLDVNRKLLAKDL